MSFGPEVNAVTNFEQTVYMLELPADNPEMLKTSLLVLHDWASAVTFDPEEIEKERGVVVEEWRMRMQGVQGRVSDKEISVLLKDSRYADRLPIGYMDVIRNISPERVVDFYKKWYRPENMAVVAVGDVKAEVLENAIKEIMGEIPASEKKTKLPALKIPVKKEKTLDIVRDKELAIIQAEIYMMSEDIGAFSTVEDLRAEYALGFASPTLIEGEGTITIPALERSNMGYRMNTTNPGEYFIIENRQRVKWDKNLAGPGMLVWRVDSSNVDIWENNLVNSNPNRSYYELLRAKFNGMSDSYNDPFPGVAGITSITNATQPNMRTWDGKLSRYAFINIAEADSIITFDVVVDNSKSSIEDFEIMPVGATLNERGVVGVYATWNFYNCAVVDTAQVAQGHAVAMRKSSYFNTAENLNKIPKVVRFKVYNPTSTAVEITPKYSINNGSTWKELNSYPYSIYVSAGSTAEATFSTFPTNQPIMLRLQQTMGSSSEYCFIDDIEICYESTWTPEYTLGDVNDDGQVTIKDVTVLIDYLLGSDVTINELAADVKADGNISIADVTALIDMLLGNL